MIEIILIGLAMGFLAGALGIGGAVLGTPLLKLFTMLPAKQALATPLPAVIPAAVSGVLAYSKNNFIRYEVAKDTLLFALPFSVLGSLLTKYATEQVLMVLTGLLLMQAGLSFIKKYFNFNLFAKQKIINKDKKIIENEVNNIDSTKRIYVMIVGALAGFLSGFLAVGGGIILVPTFTKICNLNIKESLGTSLFCVAILALPGIITHQYLGHIHWQTALILCVAVIPSSFVGANLSIKLKNRTIEIIFGIALLAFAIYFIYRNLYNVQ